MLKDKIDDLCSKYFLVEVPSEEQTEMTIKIDDYYKMITEVVELVSKELPKESDYYHAPFLRKKGLTEAQVETVNTYINLVANKSLKDIKHKLGVE